ncbi:unnamed protein product [Spirodela intermedia]|uniref:Uncharacterized protein n=1 Tax=Spirodela intermedia TaxID=51605 RepID=A0A7I8IPL6_SPIIN|nr:unnamed protein product [Spirodela intermedia]CAA6658950.1 unnamed protein product [Spirodela intermedia]
MMVTKYVSHKYARPWKSSWPELVGDPGTVAVRTIKRQNRLVKPIIVEEGKHVIENFLCSRVWVWVNKRGIVTRIPRIG